MPPSRRNLIVIVSLCLITIYLAASVRVYRSISTNKGLPTDSVTYAPYKLPSTPEEAFYQALQPSKVVQSIKDTVIPPKPTPTPTPKPVVDPITAKAYVVGDMETGKVYFVKNGKQVLPVASMSKLITAFVAADNIPGDKLIEIRPEGMELPPDTSNLLVGEKIPMKTILYPLLLSSSNIAAEAIALESGSSRSDFLELMSTYAWEVGMPSTFFADASGLSAQNAASALDLLSLATYLYKSRADILSITRTPFMTIATTTDHGYHMVTSTHPFVNDPNFIGGKTGRTTEAGETMMTIIKVEGRPVAIIVLGSAFGSREADTRLLIGKLERAI